MIRGGALKPGDQLPTQQELIERLGGGRPTTGEALQPLSSILETLMRRGRKFDHIPDFQRREIDEHREILAVVRRRDPAAASDLILRHIVQSAATYDSDGAAGDGPLLPGGTIQLDQPSQL